MPKETVDLPPFPPLRWDGYGWTGEVVLPSWAGFQARRGAYTSVSSDEPSDGAVKLQVGQNDDEELEEPSPEQVAAYRHLIENEAAVADAVGRALVAYYAEQDDARLDAIEDGNPLPDVSDPAGLRSLVGLGNVHVLPVAYAGVSYVGFEFGCVWDEEHGAGVLTHCGRVVETGQADTSFGQDVAEADARRQKRRRKK